MELRRVNSSNNSSGQVTELEEEEKGQEDGEEKGDQGKGQEGEEGERLNEDLSVGIDVEEEYKHNGTTLQVASKPYPDPKSSAGINRLDLCVQDFGVI